MPVLIDVDEPIRIGERLRAEKRRIDEAEDRRVGANAETEDDDRSDGETPVAEEASDGVVDVVQECPFSLIDYQRERREKIHSFMPASRSVLPVCAIAFMLVAGVTQPLAAADEAKVTPGEFVVEHPTLISLGFEWHIDGDANRNASVDVSFRSRARQRGGRRCRWCGCRANRSTGATSGIW